MEKSITWFFQSYQQVNDQIKKFDIYSYGVILSSTLHLIHHPFPPPDGYAEIRQTYSMTGGEALNSAIVLSRLGLKVMLDGNWIGDTTDGKLLLKRIRKYNIDTRRLKVKKEYSGVREIVFSDEQSRTIFGNYIDLLSESRNMSVSPISRMNWLGCNANF
jgi:sugar/nucleoside kinase (ribokinase family)